jgi:hypothetical protein
MIIIGLIALYASQSNFSQKELPVQVLFLFLSSISIVAIAIRASRGRMIAPQLETA